MAQRQSFAPLMSGFVGATAEASDRSKIVNWVDLLFAGEGLAEGQSAVENSRAVVDEIVA